MTTAAEAGSAERIVCPGALRVRRNKWVLAAPWLIDLAVVVAAIVARTPLVLLGLVHGTILGAVLTAYAYQRNPWHRLEDVEIAADAKGVWYGGRLAIPRQEIKQGFVYEQDGIWRVRLFRGRLSEEIQVPHEAEGRMLLRALGLDASQTVAELRVMSPFFGWPAFKKFVAIMAPISACVVGALVTARLFGKGAAPAVFGLMELFLLVGMMILLFPAKLFVGRDGLLHRWLGRTKFTPIGRVDGAALTSTGGMRSNYVGAEVVMKEGPSTKYYVGQSKWSDAKAKMLVDRIEQVLDERGRGGAIPFEASALRRGDRDVTAWIASLRALGAGARDDLRSIPADVERLLALVENPGASPLDRAAAAVALPATLPSQERDRIRIAAAATVEPHLRVALEKVADGAAEDEAVTESLAQLDAAEAERATAGA